MTGTLHIRPKGPLQHLGLSSGFDNLKNSPYFIFTNRKDKGKSLVQDKRKMPQLRG
jgi:hypothetical protein